MSSSGTAAALYAATISPASITGSEPQEAKDKRHHLKDGKGFDNPWERYTSLRFFVSPPLSRILSRYMFFRDAISFEICTNAQESTICIDMTILT